MTTTPNVLKRRAVRCLLFGTVAWFGCSLQVLASDSGFYLGAEAGRTIDSLGRADLDSAVSASVTAATGATLAIAASSARLDGATWSADVGYRASPFGVEASYLDLGRLNFMVSGTATSPFGTSPLSSNLQIRSKGPALALVGFLPLLDALEASLRIGAYEGRTTTDFSNLIDTTVHAGSAQRTSTSLMLGAGISYAVTGHVAVTVNYLHLNRLREDFLDQSFNVDLAMAGITFAF